jgi:hypothetical protein
MLFLSVSKSNCFYSEDQDDISGVQTTLVTLLQRSRTSRSRKPLSVRSAMQQSVAYTSLSRSASMSTSNTQPFPSRHVGGYHQSHGSISTQSDLAPGVSRMTADLYDRVTTATASREPVSHKGRKRPAFLALRAEDLDNQSELARYQQSRKDREHLRKSSPTVGENFTFLDATSEIVDRPMPDPPRRATLQPTLQNGTMASGQGSLRSNIQQRVEDEQEEDEDEEDDEEDEENDENHNDAEEDEEDDTLEEHLDDPPVPPPVNEEQPVSATSAIDRLSSITEESPQPRKKKSSSSVRSQIIALPETARLRKQASGELVRHESSTTNAPSLPTMKALNPARMPPSHELMKNRRQSDFTHRYQNSDPSALAFRSRRTPSRSTSQDARPHPTIPLPPPPAEDDYGVAVSPTSGSRPMSPSSVSTTILSPTTTGPEESWPLTPEMTSHPQSTVHHSRTVSEDPSFPALRSFSPDDTPRASRSNTPLYSNTPYSSTPHRARSRSNTNLLDETSYEQFNDAASVTASSIAPSTMSAQWYRTPRERLGLGGRISTRTEQAPWEQDGEMVEEEPQPQYDDFSHLHPQHQQPQPQQQQQSRPRKIQLFTIYPPKSPSAPDFGTAPEMPPRSPLLTDQFLTDVRGLPDDLSPRLPQALHHPHHHANASYATLEAATISAAEAPRPLEEVVAAAASPQTPAHPPAVTPHAQQQTPQLPPHTLQASAIPHRTLSLRSLRRSGSRAGGRAESESSHRPHKKSSSRSIIGEMAREYKSLVNKLYTSQYDDDDEREVDEQIRRMREDDIAYVNEHYRQPMSRPATSAGLLTSHEPSRIVKEITVQQQHSNTNIRNGHATPTPVGGVLHHQASRDTDSTASSFHTAAPAAMAAMAVNKSNLTLNPPGTSSSGKSAESGKSKKDKKDKKKKKPSFWSAMREESRALSSNWYQEANAAVDHDAKKGR